MRERYLRRPAAPHQGRGAGRALWARRVVDYPTKMQCCGGALDRVGERESSLAFCRRKLHDLQNHEVDALVVVCPSCFQQFDLNQAALQRANENINVPVLYLSELIAPRLRPRARGARPGHAPRQRPAVPRQVGGARRRQGALALDFDVALLNKCDSCRACKDDCPVCKVDPTFQPNDIIAELVGGQPRRGHRRRPALEVPRVLHVPRSCATPTSAWPRRSASSRSSPSREAPARSRCRRPTRCSSTTGTLGEPQAGRAQEARPGRRCPPAAAT